MPPAASAPAAAPAPARGSAPAPADRGGISLVGTLTVVSAACLFALLGPISRFAYELGVSPYAFVAWRSGVAAIAIWVLVAVGLGRGGRLVGWRSLPPRDRVALGVAALAGASLDVTMFLAYDRVPIAIVLLCFYLFPAMVAAASALLGWEPIDRVRGAALGVALAGMVAVVIGGEGSASLGSLDLVGVLLAVGSALSQAVFILVSRSGYRQVPTDQAMGVVLPVSAAMGIGLAVLSGRIADVWVPFSDPPLLLLLIAGGVFAAALPSFLFLAGVRRIGGVRAGILMLAQAPVGVALAALLLDEGIGPVQVLGGIAILAAAVIIQRAATPATAAPVEARTAAA
jgi:drug/metabolite transporter (DMT)-like permease